MNLITFKNWKFISANLVILITLIGFFQNCAQNKLEFGVADSTKAGPNDCEFGQSFVRDGQSITAFADSSVPVGSSCLSESRICDRGRLSGSYEYSTCAVGAARSCKLGKLEIPHGGSTVAYQSSSVPFGTDCKVETRQCVNGVLSGSFQFPVCLKGASSMCTLGIKQISDGTSIRTYFRSSVPVGQQCEYEDRKCSNGILSGSYLYTSCSPSAPASCLFGEQQVSHGSSVTAFEESSVNAGGTCAKQIRTCQNGVLSGSYKYSNCEVGAPVSCQLGEKIIASGNSTTAYSTISVKYGRTCSAVSEQRTCQNGILSGSFQYTSCVVQPPPPPPLGAPMVVVQSLDRQVKLTWASINAAVKYVVERSTDNKTYTQVSGCVGNVFECQDINLINNQTYYYRVYGVDSVNQVGQPAYVVGKPLAATDPNYGKAILGLTWDRVPDASYQLIQIHRNSSGTVSESTIYEGTNTSKSMNVELTNNSYTYKLKIKSSTGLIQERVFVLHGRAEGSLFDNAEQKDQRIDLGFNFIGMNVDLTKSDYGSINKIEIRRKMLGDSSYTKIKDLTSNLNSSDRIYDDTTSLVSGRTYCYQVQYYFTYGSGAPYNVPKCVTYMNVKLNGTISGNQLNLTWDTVVGASYQLIQIHRNSSGTVSESTIDVGTNTSKSMNVELTNNSYTYKLKIKSSTGLIQERVFVLHGRAEGSLFDNAEQKDQRIDLGFNFIGMNVDLTKSDYGSINKIEIRRKMLGDSSYTKIKDLTSNLNSSDRIYDDTTSLVSGRTYCYQVQYYFTYGSGAPYNVPKCVTYMNVKLNGTISGNQLNLTWDTVVGASYQLIQIHRNSSGTISESTIDVGTNTSKSRNVELTNNSYTYKLKVKLSNGAVQERVFVLHGRAEGSLFNNAEQKDQRIDLGFNFIGMNVDLTKSDYGSINKIEIRRKLLGDSSYTKIKDLTSNLNSTDRIYDDTTSLVSGRTYCYQLQYYFTYGSGAPYNVPKCVTYMDIRLQAQ